MTARDSQRSAVYAWDKRHVLARPENVALSLDACAALIAKVWNDYRPGQQPPPLKDGRGMRRGYGSPKRIALPVFARNRAYALHEIAHALSPGDALNAWHSPLWARFYVDLLEHYAGMPRAELIKAGRAQRPRRVRFAALAACPKRVRHSHKFKFTAPSGS